MNGQLLTLSKIFSERLFRIPDYQRGYAWSHKQLKDFWGDIQQLEAGRNHYTGVLTLEEVSPEVYRAWRDDLWIVESKSYQPFYIVDGQQRVTTAIVLIEVVLERLSDGETLNFTEKKDIQRKFIFDSKNGGISRSYIFGYEKDNPSYEYLKTKIFLENSMSAEGEETVYTQNLEFAKKFFTDLVSKLSMGDLEVLYKKVTQNLLFNIFTISEDVDVCVAFETMNNRGKPLSYLELLKNRLIYLSLKFSDPESERTQLRNAINDCWKTIYHNLGLNKDRPLDDDRFLVNHYLVYFGDEYLEDGELARYRFVGRHYRVDYSTDLLERRFIQKNIGSLVPESSRLTIQDVYAYVSSLQRSVRAWYGMFNPFDSDHVEEVKIWLDKLNRFGFDGYYPLVLAFLQEEDSVELKIEFLRAIERIVFLSSIVTRYHYANESILDPSEILSLTTQISSRIISSSKVIKILSDESNKISKNKDFVYHVIEVFKDKGFYRWPSVRYFLFEYNLSLQAKSKTHRPKLNWAEFNENEDDFISVEHIYPQRARHPYWQERFRDLSQKQREALRESLGNLLPLSTRKNSSLSNKPFPEKVDSGLGTVGYRFGCYAENEVTKNEHWTPDFILNRGLKLLEFMEKRWQIDLGGEESKVQMLGLSFLRNRTPAP